MTLSGTQKRAGNKVSLVYERIRAEILSGDLPPGRPLALSTLARSCRTSRGPVREALRRLQQDQLVIARANQRFNVAPLDIVDLEAVLSLHLSNTTLAIRVAVPLMTNGEITDLETCVADLDQLAEEDVSGWEAAYKAFTLTLVRQTAPRTLSLIGQLMDNIQRYRLSSLEHTPRLNIGAAVFRDIAEAARARDGELAAARYVAFFSRAAMVILTGVAPQHDSHRLRTYIGAITS